ncbi:ATP-binding protein [Leifsonia sp. Root227]|uniref:ATP-binding protein n=1 Tax=Leifsonia sp. Root227 TaxID=1736496 RepID=UPI0009E980B7|nr:LuxR C-terminal-related transcriptional regulator [Leifsonia sp. Root227]
MLEQAPAPGAGALPAEVTSLIGRRGDVAESRRRLSSGGLLTLVGPAGVGKTRIAIRLARRVERSFSDGVVFVDLLGARTGRQLLDTVTSAVGVHVVSADTDQALLEYLRDREMLIVLDNCEHLVEVAAELATSILHACPTISLLATSREALRVPGESLQLVEPLPTFLDDVDTTEPSSAVQLFIERAAPFIETQVASTQLAIIAQICERLEGLPLAIELTAARASILAVDQILEELSHSLQVVTRGGRTTHARHNTLRAAIQWSYDLCDRREQLAWRVLSVFGAPWDLGAGKAVLSNLGDESRTALDMLQILFEKSIIRRVRRGDTVWYTMLAAVREFGQERLTSEEGHRAQLAHRDWYLSRLRAAEFDWLGPRQSQWLAYFRHELPNIRVAAEFGLTDRANPEKMFDLLCVGWRIAWQADGRIDELRDWLERALMVNSDRTPSRTMARILHSTIVGLHGDRTYALGELQRIRKDAEALGEPLLASYVDTACALLTADATESVTLLQRALKVQDGDPVAVARVGTSVWLVQALERLGRTDEAETLRDEFLQAAERSGEQYESNALLLHGGAAACRRAEPDLARDLLTRALKGQRHLRSSVAIAHAIQSLAGVELLVGNPDRCAFLMGAAQPAWRFSGAKPTWSPTYFHDSQTYEQGAIQSLGRVGYEMQFAAGARLTLDEALNNALGEAPPSRTASSARTSILTARESEIVELLVEGLSDREIARSLSISIRTVQGHVQRILVKLSLHSRTQIATWKLLGEDQVS